MSSEKPKRSIWNYHPDLPIRNSPVFELPFKPTAALWWVTRKWVTLSGYVIFAGLAAIVYYNFLPDLSEMQTLSLGWIGPLVLRNLILMIVVAGLLHLYLFTFSAQGNKLKYDARNMMKNNGTFTFRDQVHDNMFWSLASGVPAWSAVEVLYFWAAANGYAPLLMFSENPIWVLSALIWMPIASSMHFYWIHRLLHWPPMYKRVHSLHHRNVNVGPWSGMSMHPVESFGYMTAPLIHLLIPTHPFMVLLHFYFKALGPAFSHAGFDRVLVKDKDLMNAGDFHHQLHHRYFECNYGTTDMPWDKWFGSFHDGTDEATEMIKERRKRMYAKAP